MHTNVVRYDALSLLARSPDPYYQVRSAPSHPKAVAFLDTWRAHAHERDLVISKDLPSRPFARFLDNLMIAEPIENDTDFRIRLAGSSLRQRYQREVSGERFSALFSPLIAEENIARLRKVQRTGTPSILSAAIIIDDAPRVQYEVILLRVLAPDETTMWNIVGIFMQAVQPPQ